MKKVLLVYKPRGLTPLQALDGLRKKLSEYEDEKLSYAGRLDPMAEGVMLVLVGEENKNREKYLRADKEYDFKVLFGIKTDTYDLMGVPKYIRTEVNRERLNDLVTDLVGEIEQEYPPFSGKTVEGVKMFKLAKEGKLPKKLPKLRGKIYSAKLLGMEKRKLVQVIEHMNNTVLGIEGDFRQKEILSAWNKLDTEMDEEFTIVRIRLSCSSGVFMRAVADDLGKRVGGVALAYSIKRLGVGKYVEKDCIKI